MLGLPNIVVFGAGAVGSTIGAWVSPHHANTWLVDTAEVAGRLSAGGITHYLNDKPLDRETVKVLAVDDLDKVPSPDVILVCVKNYSLEAVSKLIASKVNPSVIVVGFQNGVENQKILPKYFKNVIYGIVTYNAWVDAPGVVGYQKRGPLVIGTLDNSLGDEMRQLASILGLGVETLVTDQLQDAAHTKMVVNLTNSLTTLLGHKFKPIGDQALFQKLLTNLTYEGVKILKAAGFRERRFGEMPSWALMHAAAKLPQFLTRRKFEKNVRKMVMSSMAQDIIQRGGTDSELETLNGYFIGLAENHKVDAPYNRAVYELCREKFGKPGFNPIDVQDVWNRVNGPSA